MDKKSLEYVRKHYKEIIDEKKSMVDFAKMTNAFLSIPKRVKSESLTSKSISAEESEDYVDVEFIANTLMYMDHDYDVLLSSSLDNTLLKSRFVSHLHDHVFMVSSRVGKILNIRTEMIRHEDIGINKEGYAKCLVVTSRVYKDLNPSIYMQYKKGMINQHSIGFRYKDIEYADPEGSDKAKKEWEANIDNIINKEKAIEAGYFWAIKDIDLYEVSAVTIGANEITGVLSTTEKSSKDDIDFNKEKSEEKKYKINKFYLDTFDIFGNN